MKFGTFLFLYMALVLSSTARPQTDATRQLNLQESIQLALENNENILIAQNGVETANAQIREAWADALPQITFNGIYTRNFKQPVIFLPEIIFNPQGDPNKQIPVTFSSRNSYNFTVNFEQTLYQSGKVSGGIKAANSYKDYSREGFQTIKAVVILEVKKAYYTVLLDQQLLEINEQTLAQQHAHLVNTRKLFEQGQVSELDTLRAWVDYANLQPQVIRIENSLRIAENQLKELIGLELEENIVLQDALYFEATNGLTLDDIQQEALKNRPELKQLEYQSEILEQNIGITRADRLPKLFFSGSYENVAQSNSFDFGEGLQSSLSGAVRLEIPIFTGFRNSAKVQQARLDYTNALHELERFRDNLKIEVKSTVLNIQEAEKRVQVQQHAIKQAERALFMAEKRYNEGVGTQLELGDALLALNLSKTNYIQAVYDHKIALAELYKAIGREQS